MRKELLIDFSSQLKIKFRLKSDIVVTDVYFNSSDLKKSIDFSFDGKYYFFNIDNDFFTKEFLGKNYLMFSYYYKKSPDTIKNAYFKSFNSVTIKNNDIKYFNDLYIVLNKTKKGALILLVYDDLEAFNVNLISFLKSLKTKNNKIRVGGIVNPLFLSISKFEMGFENEDFYKIIFPVKIKNSLNDVFKIKIEADIGVPDDISNGSYHLYLYVFLNGLEEPIKVRFGRTRYLDRIFFKDFTIKSNENTVFISPYLTVSGFNVSFQIIKIPNKTLKGINNIKLDKKRDIWIIGEKEYRAQDNGRQFFKFLREYYPLKEVYYIIDFDSPDYENIKHLGNVVNYQSRKHFELILKATKIFFTHKYEHLLPLIHNKFKKRVKGKKIFLQHGVLGVKNLNQININQKGVFDTDIFCVSGEREKQIVIDDLQYNENQVKITGLPRFDSLFANNDTYIKNQILIVPTWRDYLQNLDLFLESEYLKRFKSLLSNENLINFAINNNTKIIFGLHPNMKQYSELFLDFILENKKHYKKQHKNYPVEIFHQGEVVLQNLIKESALLITDYSSVAYDFSFLNKPVFYYQFDQSRFLGRVGSYLDLEQELPGYISSVEEDLVLKVIKTAKNNFKMEEKYKNRLKSIISYRDTKNCQRIVDEAINFDYNLSFLGKLKISNFYIKSFGKFRRSKFYFPTMKILYKFFKLIPLKERYIFESGLGRQYADSPRRIYEELIKHKDIEAIWIYNKSSFIHPISTKICKRLSPEYYYYLATSKYWINNQNFPTYLSKRKSTVFLQTWHGTPLKKMLNDLDKVYGREEGYLTRVNNAINQWTYLISQNPYASKSFKSAFHYNGEIIEEGYPRNDVLLNEEYKAMASNKIKVQYGLNIKNKKVILYAPTFRDNKMIKANKFKEEININFNDFFNRYKDEYILLIRSHLVSSNTTDILELYKDNIVNVSDYEDIEELFLISDLLITDYSSVFFDYSILEKPMIFYAYDKEEYIGDIRGLYLDYDETVPGPIVKNQNELFEVLDNLDKIEKEYKNKILDFKKTYNPKDDGKASERIVKKYFLD